MVLIGSFVAAASSVHGQQPALLGLSPISHIGIAVSDIEVTRQHYAEIFDLSVPTINENNRLAQPDGSEDAVARAATLFFPNFLLELQQSATDFGPIHDTVKGFGQTVHHISFGVRENYRETRDHLVDTGGDWRGGTATSIWSYVDFRDRLGVALEPISIQIFDMLGKGTSNAPAGDTLGTQPVTQIGIVVRNVDEAAKAYSDILGVTIPPARIISTMDYPTGSPANPKAHIKTTSWTHDNDITIELIEPIGGPSPWSEWLEKQGGSAVHHLTFEVGTRLDEMIRRLQTKGGTLTYGVAGGTRAYLDFGDKLGIVIELTGTR
jgi:catechol 2,3-dioxygenase-like lactoylglutathione lyase family enzyme